MEHEWIGIVVLKKIPGTANWRRRRVVDVFQKKGA
jgi:hypothetical protein